MADPQTHAITAAEQRRRQRRVETIARALGFVGRVEYRHVVSGSGGGQFRAHAEVHDDLLVVDAQAFLRDAGPGDFSLEAIIAHERGHQLLFRRPVLRRMMDKGISGVSEEIMASLLGSLIVEKEADRHALHGKALHDAVNHGMDPNRAAQRILQLRQLLESAL